MARKSARIPGYETTHTAAIASGHDLFTNRCLGCFAAKGGPSINHRVRASRVPHVRRQAQRLAEALSRTHHETFWETRDKKRRLLDAARRAGEEQHAHLHFGAPQPRSRGRQLESFPGRSGMEERARQVRGEWENRGKAGLHVHGADGFLSAGAMRCGELLVVEIYGRSRAIRRARLSSASLTGPSEPI